MSPDVPIAAPGEIAGNLAVVGECGRPGVNPLPNYLGSKGALNTIRRVVRLFRPHPIYIEAFLGSGAVMRFKTPALRTIGIDEDPDVIAAWRRSEWPGVQLVNANAITWLDDARSWLPHDALVFADPPYPLETRTSDKRYAHELTEAEQVQLLDVLDSLPCSVVVSSYDNDLYRRRLRAWSHDSWPAMTRGGLRTEHAWYKHPAAEAAGVGVQAKCLGLNFRDRERIKRKVSRWAAKFDTIPERDRIAILAQLLDRYGASCGVASTADAGDDLVASSTPLLWDLTDPLAGHSEGRVPR